jgi:hypothetical protein
MTLRQASLLHAISNSRNSSKGKAGSAVSINSLWLLLLLLTSALLIVTWQAVQLRYWHPSAAVTDGSSLQEALQEAAAGAAAASQSDEPAPAPGVQHIAYPVWWHAPFYSGTGSCVAYVCSNRCKIASAAGTCMVHRTKQQAGQKAQNVTNQQHVVAAVVFTTPQQQRKSAL